jgi:glycolate oxidase
MGINKEAYLEIEEVVGPQYISDDPAVQDSYRSRDLTIVLPANTEQVASIIKICNKYRVTFKAVSTGWAFFPPGQDIVYMDLRRMNHLIEINEKSLYAVVEPYVISAQLHAELIKRGLHTNMKGSGSQCTALALSGHGHLGYSTSTGDRNDLATEWVTDEGEIVRLGSLASCGEWFCGDGPGPSLRSIIRSGGIITKQATKLYHWPGPSRFPLEGTSPSYYLNPFPSNFMVRYFTFPTREKLINAEIKIGESEIAFELMGFCISMVSSNISTNNEEDFANLEKLTKLTRGRPGFMVILAGNFPEDLDYKKAVLDQIMQENDGESLKAIEEDKNIEGTLLFQCTRITGSIRETFRAGGLFSSVMIEGQRYTQHVSWLEEAAVRKRELIKQGLIVTDDGQQFGWGEEMGQLGHSEIFCRHTTEPKSWNAVIEWGKITNRIAVDNNICIPLSSPTMALPIDTVGPLASNYHIWYGKLKQAFDPNSVGELTGFSLSGSDSSARHTSIYDTKEKTARRVGGRNF